MIKVNVSLPDQEPIFYTFEENIITIGSAPDQSIILNSEDELIFPEHLKIIKEQDGYSILNIQEDATTMLNGQGFSQSLLSSGDKLTIGPITVSFEEVLLDSADVPPTKDLSTEATDSEDLTDELLEAEKLLEEAEASLQDEETQETQEQVSPIEEEVSSAEADLEQLLADIDLSKEDLEDLQDTSLESVEDLDLDSDLTQIKDLLNDDELAELNLEKETEKTFEKKGDALGPDSAELSDEELERMLLEIHGDEQSKEDYEGSETGALLSSLKEEKSDGDSGDQELEIEFLDEVEPNAAKAEEDVLPLVEATEENSDEEEEEEEEREIPLGSIRKTYEEFGEYTEEKAQEISQASEKEQEDKSTLIAINKKQLLSVVAVYVITLSLLALGVFATYSSITSSNQYYTRLASRGLADYAMALAHNQATPENYKVSDSLRAVLPPQYLNSSEIYHTGSFKRAPYTLKVFQDDNRTSFLLLAEPKAGFLQNFLPKDSIVIDSESMLIRKSKKVADLAAVLSAGENNLGLVDRSDLSATLDAYALVPTKELEEEDLGFAPPSELAQLFPSSELYVYNSPRYYKFSQLLGKKVTDFISNQDALVAFQDLSKSLSSFNKFKGFVLYYSTQEREAQAAYSVLKSLYSKRDFAVGHLMFNPDSGTVKGANILTKDEVSQEQWQSAKDIVAQVNTIKEAKIEKLKKIGLDASSNLKGGLDFNSHPVYTSVSKAVSEREEHLEEASTDILNLLKKNNKAVSSDFEEENLELNENYKEANLESKKRLSNQLRKIFTEEVEPDAKANLPIFLSAVDENELEDFVPESVKEQIEFIRKKRTSKKDVDFLIQNVEKSKDFPELHKYVSETDKILQPKFFDKATAYVNIKNRFKSAILNRVKVFILDNSSYDHNHELKKEHRNLLEEILQIAEVNEGEELNFYLDEFDYLVEQFYSLPKKDTLENLQASNKEIVQNLQKDVFLSEEQQALLKEQTKETKEQIDLQSSKVAKVQQQIEKIPLDSYQASTPDKQKTVNSRMGQQILVRESLEEPGEDRDGHLLEALSLLQQGIYKNRSLWGDVLQIRNLLSQTPEKEMLDVVYSEIGFDPKKAPLSSSIRKISKKYIEAKSKLASVATDKNRYFADRGLFTSTQQKNLEKIIDIAQETQRLTQRFQLTLDTYIHKLEEFLLDYDKAKNEGFFVKNQQYHAVMSSRLSLKLKRFRRIRDAFLPTMDQLTIAAQSHEQLAQEELDELFTKTIIDSENINALTKRDNEITYPDLASINIAKQVSELVKIKVSPIR